jgi:hypothetical protein
VLRDHDVADAARGRRERCREDLAARFLHVELDPVGVRHDRDPTVAGGLEPGVGRRSADPRPETLEPVLGVVATDGELARAVVRQREQLRDPALAQAPPGLPELEPDRSGECAARLCEHRPELVGRHGDRFGLDRERRLRTGERGECADDGRRRALAIQLAAGLTVDEHGLETVEHDRRLAVVLVELVRDLRELILERGLVDLSRWSDIGAEDPDPDALEPAQRPQALPLPPGRVDRGRPVGLDAEPVRSDLPALRAAEEGHGDVLEHVRAPLEELLRSRRGHPSDADARDRDAGRDPRRRACEDRAEERRQRERDGNRRRKALQEQPRTRASSTRFEHAVLRPDRQGSKSSETPKEPLRTRTARFRRSR